MAAYALAWVRFRGSDFIFFTIFALQVVPLQMALVPLLQLLRLGRAHRLVHDHPGAAPERDVCPVWISHTMFALPLAMFLLHNFIAQLPGVADRGGPGRRRQPLEDLPHDRAAAVDAGDRVVRDLPVPVGVERPAGRADLRRRTRRPAPLTARLAARRQLRRPQELLAPAGFIAIIVPLIVFLSLQRYFVRGLLAGSVKG